ncbi:MAG TPA: hypothetical protein PLR52_02350 [Bacteroidales bacterium]|nr:hypothetical protein [Bacteroidales bacterium]HPI68278.1 hypothetical protein [Bacteroidales bacterium]HPR72890.1 hypothetical protein [Bacteroidales bacterium]
MRPEDKYKWMIWAISFLALMNIATIATVIYNRQKTEEQKPVQEPLELQTGNRSMRFSQRYFRDQLNLNRDQMIIFNEHNIQFRQEVRDINLELINIRQQMLEEMSALKSDTALLNRLSDSIGHLHSELKKITYTYYLDIKNICDEQQRQKLESLFGGLFTIDSAPGQYGRQRGQYGRGQGRGFNNFNNN